MPQSLCVVVRDIAGAIKELLDAVNLVSKAHQDTEQMAKYKRVRARQVDGDDVCCMCCVCPDVGTEQESVCETFEEF